jgi:hypothetical protein
VRGSPSSRPAGSKQRAKDGGAQVEREIENVLAAIRAGGNNGAATLLRKELDRLRAERDQMAQQQADLEGDAIGKALEQALAALPAVVAGW